MVVRCSSLVMMSEGTPSLILDMHGVPSLVVVWALSVFAVVGSSLRVIPGGFLSSC